LDDPNGLKLFEEHCVSEFSTENLKFYRVVKLYQTNYAKLPDPTTTAKQIYATFIDPGSVMEINIKSETRDALMRIFAGKNSNIVTPIMPSSSSKKGDAPGANVFDEAAEEVCLLPRTLCTCTLTAATRRRFTT